jgi:hypothetical protein
MQILGVNAEFSKKVQTLRTLIDISDAFSTDEKKENKSKLNGMTSCAATRNMVAHCSFVVSDDGAGVTFLRVQASGDFAELQTFWNDTQLQTELQRLSDYQISLNKIEQRLRPKPVDPARFWAVLRATDSRDSASFFIDNTRK